MLGRKKRFASKTKKKPKKRKKKKVASGQRCVTSLVAKGHESRCACCGSVKKLTFDHVIPKSKGGKDTTENGQILCTFCNNHKADRIIAIPELRFELGILDQNLRF